MYEVEVLHLTLQCKIQDLLKLVIVGLFFNSICNLLKTHL